MASAQDRLQKLAQDYAIAWSSGDARSVAGFFAETAEISTNGVISGSGRDAVAEVAQGYFTAFPDLEIRCDLMRRAGSRAIFVWTFDGHHAGTGNPVIISGWEEWRLSPDMQILSAARWFDEDSYNRQIDGHGTVG